MAVYKQTYRGYQGALAAPRWRWLLLYRYARRALFESRLLLGFFLFCYLLPVLALLLIYAMHNPAFLGRLNIHLNLTIGPVFFGDFLHWQCLLAFLFTACAAPGLISADLAHGGLALYLARPFSRLQYLAGKFTVLFVLLAEITWIPALILFTVQANDGGAAWRAQYLWLGWSISAACIIFIVVVALLALALSAWIKWRIVAGATLLGIYFFGAGLGLTLNLLLRTQYGSLLDIMGLHLTIWSGLLRLAPPTLGLEFASWAVLAGIALGSLVLILRKLRPLEVVR